MGTRSIDVMTSRPGIYMLVGGGYVVLVEVDAAGRCWQLELDDYRRDGELQPGGWFIESIISILGPFQRTVTVAA